jgi:hypothetical protein
MRPSISALLAAPVLAGAIVAVLLASGPGPRPAYAGGDRLARDQPVAGADVIALELHVDYWNYLGWADPFSRAAFTERQRAYADGFGQRGVYTPQMVVGGEHELVGSNERGARDTIAEAARVPGVPVQLGRRGDDLEIQVGVIGDARAGTTATVWLALTEDGLSTRVPRGENAGATLAHGPVVRDLRSVGAIAAGTSGPVTLTAPAKLDPSWSRDRVRAVAFVQRDGTRAILGAAAVSMR